MRVGYMAFSRSSGAHRMLVYCTYWNYTCVKANIQHLKHRLNTTSPYSFAVSAFELLRFASFLSISWPLRLQWLLVYYLY